MVARRGDDVVLLNQVDLPSPSSSVRLDCMNGMMIIVLDDGVLFTAPRDKECMHGLILYSDSSYIYIEPHKDTPSHTYVYC